MTELVLPERNNLGATDMQARFASSPGSSRHVLVVADEPCSSPGLCASVCSNAGNGPTDVLVIAPTHGAAATRWYFDARRARADATHRLRAWVACLRAADHARRRAAGGRAIPRSTIDALSTA